MNGSKSPEAVMSTATRYLRRKFGTELNQLGYNLQTLRCIGATPGLSNRVDQSLSDDLHDVSAHGSHDP